MTRTLIIAAATALAALAVTGIAWSDGDHGRGWGSGIAPVQNETYRTECGACHIAYPPALLPAAGWTRITDDLGNHFGDDASLDPVTTERIRSYLLAGAADAGPGLRAHAFAASTGQGDGLPRITRTRYFLSQHDEIPQRLVSGNPQVRGFSACQACHKGAEQGRFDEDEVQIPGVGRWGD